MDNTQILEQIEHWGNYGLLWIGFGTVVGLLAKAIMPGRDPGGAIATLAMGVGGTVIGCAILTYFYQGEHVKPISPLGFVAGTGGAFLLLFFYKLLGGYWFLEGETRRRSWFRRPRRTRRCRKSEYVDA